MAFRPDARAAAAAPSAAQPGPRGAAAVRSVQSMLRVRAPAARPRAGSSWEDELWRLQRVYRDPGALEYASSDDGRRRLTVVHQCTDPDWEAVNWAPEGLTFEVDVPATYPERLAPEPALRVLAPAGLPARFAELVPRLFAESVAKAEANSPAVYRALQHVDHHLAALWLKLRAISRGEVSAPASGESGDTRKCVEVAAKVKGESAPWSQEEQARLDAAIVEFRAEADAKRRWAAIADRVGGGRSPKECADRFRVSRGGAGGARQGQAAVEAGGAALAAPPPPPPPPPVAQATADAAAQQREALAAAASADEIRRLGAEVRLVGLCLEGFTSMLPTALRLQVVCTRCRKPSELESEGFGDRPRAAAARCPVCSQDLEVEVAPAICHGRSAAVAHVLGRGCQPVQLLRSDFAATCGECADTVRVRNVGPGYRKRSNCAGCHAKQNLVLEGAEVLGSTVARWRDIAAAEDERLTTRRRLQDARRQERDMGVRVGQPLPHQGACKHYAKSYRWLRFPCCGRAFPCDECHDEASDHGYEWATRALCGYCSFEQVIAKDKCGHCGKATTRERTAFWEGGEGCRNRTLMSRSDEHKYRGLGKCISNRAVAKAAAR